MTSGCQETPRFWRLHAKGEVQQTHGTQCLLMIGLMMLCSVSLDFRCKTPSVTHAAETSKSANTKSQVRLGMQNQKVQAP